MKWKAGDFEGARPVFQRATQTCPKNAPLWMEWALMEWEAGALEEAARLFEAGSKVPRSYQHPPLYDAWARLEAQAGRGERAAELQDRYLQAERDKRGGAAAAGGGGAGRAAAGRAAS
jgi:thioredoxin-like negative regulator of GroEL